MYRSWINRRSWFRFMAVVLFSVYVCWMLCLWVFTPGYAFVVMLCVWFHVLRLKSGRKSERVSIVSLIEPENSCKECSRICPQGVRWQKGSGRGNVCSLRFEGAVRHSAVQGVHRPGERSQGCEPERKSEWVSIISLIEPEDSCKECSQICPQGVRWQKGSIRDIFCSHFLKGAVRHSVMKGVRRPS